MTDVTTPPTAGAPEIQPISIVSEMRTSFLDYAMSVIVARALPDVRDGLKPVHRRILWGSFENGFTAGKPYRKSARIVGDVMGKYHPHGDSAIYDALARMTQDWSMRLPLIDGQGNFGSMDPDAPAAMRYTEARLAKSAESLLADIDKDTVDFVPNYDGSEREPAVLPTRFPNLLVNGAGGIAVGMATNIPPHNLSEVIDAVRAWLDAEGDISTADLMKHLPAPDFPTGGLIVGTSGLYQAYETGRGSILMRSRHEVEEGRGDRRSLVLTEIPYQQGKNALVEKLAEAIKDKRIEGVADLRDESNREGVRIVMDLKREATPDVVLNQVWRHTPAQQSFAINMLAINGGRPELMGLKDIIRAFVAFREQVITRRAKFELAKARERAHVLIGQVIAVANLDEVVATIRGSASPAAAREALLARAWDAAEVLPYLALVESAAQGVGDDGTIHMTDAQVRAILDLRLQKLTALGREEIAGELREIGAAISALLAILADRAKLYAVLRAELDEVADAFPMKRRTELVAGGDDLEDEDLIEREDMVVTVTMSGWIKRVPLAEYRVQGRGGRGKSAMATKDEDAVTTLFVTSTHNPVLFFSSAGKVYRLKVWRLPQGSRAAKGRHLSNLLPLSEGETITTVLPLPEDERDWGRLHVMFATARGGVRRNAMDAFANVPSAGKLAIRFEEGDDDRLIGVALCEADEDVFLAAKSGKAIRFPVDDVREFVSRTSTGVRGMSLDAGDEVVSMAILKRFDATPLEREDYLKAAAWKGEGAGERVLSETRQAEFAAAEEFILTVTRNGFGKRSSAFEYRRSGRGGLGIRNIAESERNGDVVASMPAHDGDEIMLVTDQAQLIRLPVASIRIMGRAAQGVTLFRVGSGEHVVSAALIPAEEAADAVDASLAALDGATEIEGDGAGDSAASSDPASD